MRRYVYQHHTVKIVDDMLCDILEASDAYVLVPGANGLSKTMSEAVEDMCAAHSRPWRLHVQERLHAPWRLGAVVHRGIHRPPLG